MNEMEETPVEQTSEDKIRRAKTPGDFCFLVAGMIGEGKNTSEIVSSLFDAKVEDSDLPEGTDRAMVKKGVLSLLEELRRLWVQ